MVDREAACQIECDTLQRKPYGERAAWVSLAQADGMMFGGSRCVSKRGVSLGARFRSSRTSGEIFSDIKPDSGKIP